MEKLIQRLSIRQLMLGFYTVSVFIFSGILLFGFLSQRQDMIEQNSANFESLITQMSQSITEKCELYNNMLTKMAYSQSTQNWLVEDQSVYDRETTVQLTEYFKNYISLDDTIRDVVLFSSNGKHLSLASDVMMIQKISQEIPEKTPYYYTGFQRINISLTYPRIQDCILLGTRVYSIETFDRENSIGTMVFVLDAEKLLGLEGEKAYNTMKYLVFDREGKVLCNDKSFISEEMQLEKLRAISSSGKAVVDQIVYAAKSGKIPYLNCEMALMVSERELLKEVNQLGRNQILLFCFAILIEIPLFCFSISWITKPVNQLVVFFGKNRENGVTMLKQRVVPGGPVETRQLGRNINEMLEEMNQMTHQLVDTTMRLYEAEVEKKQAELEFLYAQINPHFLFNTLESIKGCAVTEDAWKSFKMLDALGNVFRYSVMLESEVSIREELKLVRNYFHIQKMRLGDKLNYEILVPDQLMDFVIPKMILQPLVENAVIHGVGETDHGGVIWIEAEESPDYIWLTVRNSGNVIAPEKFEEIQNIISRGFAGKENKKKKQHIGLYNVNNRLQHIYGDDSKIIVQLEEMGGLKVTLQIQRKVG